MNHPTRIFALLVATGALAACDNLAPLPRNQCGNTVIERGEDCDGAGLGANVCNQLCRLECTVDGACPPGWGCGADGLCRQPTGFFAPAGNSLSVSADRLALADVDGDGGKDVLASRAGGVTIAFAEAGGLSPETSNISFATADAFPDVPSAGDIDGDGRADLALRLGTSIGILRGQRDRTLTPQVFTRPLAIPDGEYILLAQNWDGRPEAPGDEIFALGATGISLAHSSNDVDFPGQPLLSWPTATPILLGNLNGIAYGFEGKGEIHDFRPIAGDPVTGKPVWNQGSALLPVQSAQLPAGATVKKGVFSVLLSATLDGAAPPGYSSILVAGEAGGQSRLYLAFYISNGLHSLPALGASLEPDGMFTELGRTGAAGAQEAPFLVLDLDGDGGPDLFTPRGFFTSHCPLPDTTSEQCTVAFTADPPHAPIALDYVLTEGADPGDAWTGVHSIGAGLYDVDVNDYYDMLVTTEKPGFLLFRNLSTSQTVKTFRIPTAGPVKHVAVGDFNGDGARDIVFAQPSQRARPGDPPLDSVHVAWGDALGFPTTPVDLGDVGEVTQIFGATLFPTPSSKSAFVPKGDSLRDFVVRAKREGETFSYVFAGSTDDQIQSPLDLESACKEGNAPAGVPRFSALLGRNGQNAGEVAVVYRKEGPDDHFEYDLWSFRPDTTDSEAICASLVGPTPLPDPGGAALSMIPVDLDSDGDREVLLFAEGSSTLLVAELGSAGWAVQSVDLGASYLRMTTAPVFTAGGAGAADVILWSETAVTVLRNDGTGALDPADAATVSIAEVSCPGPAGAVPAGEVTGVAAVHLRPDVGRELLVVTEDAVLTVEIADAQAGTLGAPACAPLLLAGGAGGGTEIASGDVDGDGVEDLVIARPGGVQLLTGIPVVQ